MQSSNSTWDRKSQKRSVSPAFSRNRSRVIFELENRKFNRTFSANLGRVEFYTEPSKLEDNRNSIIKNEYGNSNYQSISNTHILPVLLDENFTVLGHGIPTQSGFENCSLVGSSCLDGSNSQCAVGKCVMGALTHEGGRKWRYNSFTAPGLYYYVFGDKEIRLRSIRRGRFTLPAGAGIVSVPHPASVSCRVLLPPKLYASETFTRLIIKRLSADGDLLGLEDSANNFCRLLLKSRQSGVNVEQGTYTDLLNLLEQDLAPEWYEIAKSEVDVVWAIVGLTNLSFALECYGVLSNLYNRAVQVSLNGFRVGRVEADPNIGRPIYGRLPGISGAYSDNSAAEWLTSGPDSELSFSKSLLDSFYNSYLNPLTCYPRHLDWIAQHFGFTSSIWNLNWSFGTKRLLLENAHVNNLAKYGGVWVEDNPTFNQIDLSRIECVEVVGSQVIPTHLYTTKTYNSNTQLTTLEFTNILTIGIKNWPGLLPARGSMTSLLFMFWAFGIKAHLPSELYFDSSDSTYRVRSGLRELEFNAPINIPYSVDVLHVGDEVDQEVENYPNQLIAGIGICYDEQMANTFIIRMPFYYNRDGRTWDATGTILDGWLPSTAIGKVQYAYAVADLLVAEDIFFEPQICNG